MLPVSSITRTNLKLSSDIVNAYIYDKLIFEQTGENVLYIWDKHHTGSYYPYIAVELSENKFSEYFHEICKEIFISSGLKEIKLVPEIVNKKSDKFNDLATPLRVIVDDGKFYVGFFLNFPYDRLCSIQDIIDCTVASIPDFFDIFFDKMEHYSICEKFSLYMVKHSKCWYC